MRFSKVTPVPHSKKYRTSPVAEPESVAINVTPLSGTEPLSGVALNATFSTGVGEGVGGVVVGGVGGVVVGVVVGVGVGG